jgi:hypothetical protein
MKINFKKALVFNILIICSAPLFSQKNNFEERLSFGQYEVGYKDTIVYDSSEIFSYNSYQGYKPYFTHIWYPCIKSNSESDHFKYTDYWEFHTSKENEELLKMLMQIYSSQTFGSQNFPEIVLNQISSVNYRAPQLKNKLPIILYHHGSQGIGIENNKLCEYFASHGYVVISPNFTLPSDIVPKLIPSSLFKSKFDLTNLNEEIMSKIDDEMSNAEFRNIDFFLRAIKKLHLSSNEKIIGIGHSHGAQLLFLSDRDKIDRLDKVIALHTMYEEDKPSEICEIRPRDCEIIERNKDFFSTPKYFIAPHFFRNDSIHRPDFTFHQKIPNSVFIELKAPIQHNAFVYDWLIYNFSIGNTPKKAMFEYNEILKLCLSIIKNKHLKTDSFMIVSTN